MEIPGEAKTLCCEAVCEATGNALEVSADDGKVVNAYLRRNGKITAAAWLYNLAPAPDKPDWEQPDAAERIPFLNAKAYIKEDPFAPIATLRDVRVFWSEAVEGRQAVALKVRGMLLAILLTDSLPGWSARAAKDGPIAKALDDDGRAFTLAHPEFPVFW